MDGFFGASVQVVALIIAIVCLVSSILGRSYGIGPVQVPAPRELLPRALLAMLGFFLLTVAFWSNLVGKSAYETIASFFSPPDTTQFSTDNKAFNDLLLTSNVSLVAVRVRADNVYAEAPGGTQRCLVVREIMEAYRNTPDAYPLAMLADAAKFRQGTADTRPLRMCATEMTAIATLSDGVKRDIAPSAPSVPPTLSATAVTRAQPAITTHGAVSEDLARRVLSASTLDTDSGWIFIGFRDKDKDVLIADRRIAVAAIPRSGVVAMIADSELLDTKDPRSELGKVIGYVRAGSAVQILDISGPRHYTNGVWDGYDTYALVRIRSLPQTSVAAAVPSASGASSPTSTTSALPCPAPPTPSATTFTYCNETYPARFADYFFQSYRVTDSHSTGIHFRNIGPRPVRLSIFPSCQPDVSCPRITDALVPPVSNKNDGSNDYIYTVETLHTFNYGWEMRIPEPSPA